MGLKSRTTSDIIVVQHTQRSKMHAFRIVPTGKTERMVGFEPTVVGVSAAIGGMEGMLRWRIRHDQMSLI